jgi:hypothetical protein
MTEEPTQQIRLRSETASSRPGQVTPPLPAGLDPRGRRREGEPADGTGPADGTEPTGVLHLDELFATAADAERHIDRPSIEEAPTWTAMPIVPVRSEPYPPATPAPPTTARGAPGPTALPPVLTGPPLAPKRPRAGAARARSVSATTGRRLSTDLAAAKRRTGVVMMRTNTWLRRDDNALMLMTALIACMLILLVAAVGH